MNAAVSESVLLLLDFQWYSFSSESKRHFHSFLPSPVSLYSLTPPSLHSLLHTHTHTHHTHTHTHTHTGVRVECPPELIWRKTKFWSIQYVLQYLKQRSVAPSLTHSHSHTHIPTIVLYMYCTVYVHMVERTHTLNRHTRNTRTEPATSIT